MCAKCINSGRAGTASALFIVISPVTTVVPDIVGAQETFVGGKEREKGRRGRREEEKKKKEVTLKESSRSQKANPLSFSQVEKMHFWGAVTVHF